MLFRLVTVLMVCGPMASAAAQGLKLDRMNRSLNNKDLEFLAGKVRLEGFPCRQADDGVYLGETQRSRRFRITCDGDKFTYRIEQEAAKQFRIEFEQ